MSRSGTIAMALAPACVASTALAQLTWVDSSGGLGSPVMESGGTEIEFGDVDGDGNVDLVSIGDHGSPFINTDQHGVMVWFGDGAGGWSVVQTGNFGYGGVALGDVNDDGLMDVAYGMHHDYSGTDLGDQLLEVALGDGSGQVWMPWDDGLASAGETWGMFGTDLADIDGDGDLDVGSISFGCCAGVHAYRNEGDGTWTHAFGFVGGNSSRDFVFGDVNGDGHADFAAAHGDGTVYLGDGAGSFSLADGNLGGGPWRRGIALGDVLGDGRDELAFADSDGIHVWRWVDDGSWQEVSGPLSTLGPYGRTQIADMDLDGLGDIVAHGEDHVVIYASGGDGTWALLTSIPLADACGDIALRAGVDADRNGFPDLAVISEETCDPWLGGTNRPRFFREATVPTRPSVHPAFPRGGETLRAGSVRFVRWHAAVPSGVDVVGVEIELSTTGPDGPWMTVAESIPDNGQHQWRLPASLATSAACHLRLTLGSDPPVSAITAAPFTIIGTAADGDVNGDGVVNVVDLVALIQAWGPCPDPPAACPADLDGDGTVGVGDLVDLLLAWS